MTEPIDGYIQIGGLRLHYLEWGETGRPPMLLIHGARGHAHLWDSCAAAMASDYHIFALDQRGHGQSEHSPDLSYRPEDYLGEISEFVAALDLAKFALIGHSMGGLHAMMYGGTHPDKVSRLVIVDIEASLSWQRKEFMRQASERPPRRVKDLEEAIEKEGKEAPGAEPEALRQFTRHLYRPTDSGSGLVTRTDRSTLAFFDEYDALPFLPGIQCPTLIVRGSASKILTAEAAFTMKMFIPNCELAVVEGAAHQVMLEKPREFVQVVRQFLGEKI